LKRTPWIAGLAAAAAAVSALTLSLTTTAHAAAARPAAAVAQQPGSSGQKPTVVLVHGAWADASSWTPVIERLEKAGYTVDAPPNPLRGLDSDSAYIASYLKQIKGPVVLVGHSYGGAVITNAAVGDPNVKALVYIAGWAPDQGDSLMSLAATPAGQSIPGLPTLTTTYPKPDGTPGQELTINPAEFPAVFFDNELPKYEEQAFAAEQRPFSVDAASETSGTPAWKTIPAWYMVAKEDHAIAPDLERFMAARAHAHTVQVDGPHMIMLTSPGAVTSLIEQAATATAG
jgi:pimeloyl-ACP methyl ester carboxylesterase